MSFNVGRQIVEYILHKCSCAHWEQKTQGFIFPHRNQVELKDFNFAVEIDFDFVSTEICGLNLIQVQNMNMNVITITYQ